MMEPMNVADSVHGAPRPEQHVKSKEEILAELETEKAFAVLNSERAEHNMLHEQISSVLSDAMAVLKKTGEEARQAGR